MMKHLQGKNLAHPGCLIGVTTGLIIGIILAGILASVFNAPYTTVLLAWFGLTFILGAIGWTIGTILTGRYPIPEEKLLAVAAGEDTVTPTKASDLQSSQS